MKRYLAVVLGSTATGKSKLAVMLAEKFGSMIISADSRQFYREMQVGTSRLTEKEMSGVQHYFSGHISIHDYYSAGRFEIDVLTLLEKIFENSQLAILCGGSGLYIDAVCQGISNIPDIDSDIRERVKSWHSTFGLEKLLEKLRESDPEYYQEADKNNPKRILRALEVIEQTGRKFSEIRRIKPKPRLFNIIKTGIELPRDVLYRRINDRVDRMIQDGLVEEARELYPYRDLAALQTVGYEEMFSFFEGKYDLAEAIRLIKRNTRRYAKRQITWFKKDPGIHWFSPEDIPSISSFIGENLELK